MRVPDLGSDRPDCVLGGFLCCRENVLDELEGYWLGDAGLAQAVESLVLFIFGGTANN